MGCRMRRNLGALPPLPALAAWYLSLTWREEVQGCKGAEVQRRRGEDVQKCRGTGVQRYRGTDI